MSRVWCGCDARSGNRYSDKVSGKISYIVIPLRILMSLKFLMALQDSDVQYCADYGTGQNTGTSNSQAGDHAEFHKINAGSE